MKVAKNHMPNIYCTILILTQLVDFSFQLSKCSTYPKAFGSNSEEIYIY